MPFAHATCLVTRPETREHGTWLREFWLTAGHPDWVEVGFEAPTGPRSRPDSLDRLLVTRGKLGELLGQEFLGAYPDRGRLLALQADADALRAGEDATRWSPEREEAIAAAQEAAEDAFYAAECPLGVTVLVLSHDLLGPLRRDFDSLRLPLGRFVDATPPAARAGLAEEDKQLSM